MQAPDTKPLQTLAAARSTPSRTASSSSASPSPTAFPFAAHFPFMRLDVYVVARTLATRVHAAPIRNAELRDQATRAATSALLNLAEGLPSDQPGLRRRYFRSSDGSVHELAAALDCAAAIGALDEAEAAEAIALAGRMRALLRGLLR